MSNYTGTCRQCGETLKGRRDKKFCDDQCRSQFNNVMYRENAALMRGIDRILKRNRKILEFFLRHHARRSVPLQSLTAAGLHPEFFTHTMPLKNGAVYRFCYEFGYMISKGQQAVLIKKEDVSAEGGYTMVSSRVRQ